eukprot:CAMPEP_0204894284 /NCGR_PEP_ID=MMETSP1349-20130617/33339_1 /ASSEMBLY_ACC=CAM_ASM_000710 /TAXON_ID=215587 /ORGANISM="Aplanochytrium stocchinoi, Strain GSBS06" /LENGTH=104 /DNA_ID=CAMNT_0052061441 /DNA_START=56 /DNA_END=370 /DNA_ORIENTATION=+
MTPRAVMNSFPMPSQIPKQYQVPTPHNHYHQSFPPQQVPSYPPQIPLPTTNDMAMEDRMDTHRAQNMITNQHVDACAGDIAPPLPSLTLNTLIDNDDDSMDITN